jgi:hypothetical protein
MTFLNVYYILIYIHQFFLSRVQIDFEYTFYKTKKLDQISIN